MKLEDADPWFGDIVRGPDGTTARVYGTGSIPEEGPEGVTRRAARVYGQRDDGSHVDWREGETVIVTLCEDIPLDMRLGRREPRKT